MAGAKAQRDVLKKIAVISERADVSFAGDRAVRICDFDHTQ